MRRHDRVTVHWKEAIFVYSMFVCFWHCRMSNIPNWTPKWSFLCEPHYGEGQTQQMTLARWPLHSSQGLGSVSLLLPGGGSGLDKSPRRAQSHERSWKDLFSAHGQKAFSAVCNILFIHLITYAFDNIYWGHTHTQTHLVPSAVLRVKIKYDLVSRPVSVNTVGHDASEPASSLFYYKNWMRSYMENNNNDFEITVSDFE